MENQISLSRRSGYRPEKGGVENQPITSVLRKNHYEERLASTFICSSARLSSLPARKWSKEFLGKVKQEGKKDNNYKQAMEQDAVAGEPAPKDQKVKEIRIKDGLAYRTNLLWIPNWLIQQIMESEHGTKVAGHMSQGKTIELIRRNFWWLKLNKRIIDFVRSCPECQQKKAPRHQPYGLSSPLQLSYAPWQSIAMDFITELAESEVCDQLWIVIDRFTKMAYFLPLRKDRKTAADLVVIFARDYGSSMASPQISCQTETHALLLKSGRSFYGCWEFGPGC